MKIKNLESQVKELQEQIEWWKQTKEGWTRDAFKMKSRAESAEVEVKRLSEPMFEATDEAKLLVAEIDIDELQSLKARLVKAEEQQKKFPLWTEERFKTKPQGVFKTIFWDKDKYFTTLGEWNKELEKALGGVGDEK